MRRLATSLLLIFGLTAAEPAQLSRVGIFHNGETPVRNGQTWLALVPSDGDQYRWTSVTVSARKVPDPANAPEPASQVAAPGSPLALVRGIPSVSASTPVTTYTARPRQIAQDSAKRTAVSSDCQVAQHAPTLQLRCGSRTQVLYRWAQMHDDAAARVVWSGDLDGDGRLDLLLDITPEHYNFNEFVLLLSSAAKPGELVRRVAVQRTSGC